MVNGEGAGRKALREGKADVKVKGRYEAAVRVLSRLGFLR